MSKTNKLYDIYFTTVAHPCFCIEAPDVKKAKELGEEMLVNMDKKEILRRIADALDLCGTKVTLVERV